MRQDYIKVSVLWFALTFVGFLFLPATNAMMLPFRASEEGILIDEAFSFLMMASIPVFGFVLAVMIYSIFSFRSDDEASYKEDPNKSTGTVYIVWLFITSLLAMVILVYGIIGVDDLRSNPTADMEVQVIAEKWNWDFVYSDYDVTLQSATELVLPVDTRIKFEVTSLDILHSFWIPAFRMKIDAVPGLTTLMYVTTNETGSFTEEDGLRVQCAELCGSGHARMRTPVIIMEEAEFEAWIADQQQAQITDSSVANR